MLPPRLARSLSARLLAFMMLGVVTPLIIVGLWLSHSVTRSGEQLMLSQLTAVDSSVAHTVAMEWQARESDVLLLAENAPIRRALAARAAPGDEPPSFERDAFATTRSLDTVVIQGADGAVRWTLTPPSAATASHGARTVVGPRLRLRVAIPAESTGSALGHVTASVFAGALVPPDAAAGAPKRAIIALYERESGMLIPPTDVPVAPVDRERFEWEGEHWFEVRDSLTSPAVDVIVAAPVDSALRGFRTAERTGATVLAIIGLAVILLAVGATSRLTASLGRLAVAADAVARGDLDQHVESDGHDEIGRVSRAFNGMIDNLRQTMSALSQREATAAVGELAAMIAHQVRSPLTSLKLDLQRASEKLAQANAEQASPLVAHALREVDRLEHAASASLRIARSGSGAFAPVELHRVVVAAATGVASLAAAHGVVIRDETASGPRVTVIGDDGALAQMFGNVLANAVEAATRQVSITIEVYEGRATVCIADDGAGMNPETLARAGEPLFTRKPGGTGLGLALANRVAAAHRGVISIESVEGQGTMVCITLTGKAKR